MDRSVISDLCSTAGWFPWRTSFRCPSGSWLNLCILHPPAVCPATGTPPSCYPAETKLDAERERERWRYVGGRESQRKASDCVYSYITPHRNLFLRNVSHALNIEIEARLRFWPIVLGTFLFTVYEISVFLQAWNS